LLDALLITDIGVDVSEDTDLRAGTGRDVHTRLGHQRSILVTIGRGRIDAVNEVGVHDLEVTRGIMAGRIGHHGGMVLGHTRIERSILSVPVCLRGIGGPPVLPLRV
jgi:hypothetical protein